MTKFPRSDVRIHSSSQREMDSQLFFMQSKSLPWDINDGHNRALDFQIAVNRLPNSASNSPPFLDSHLSLSCPRKSSQRVWDHTDDTDGLRIPLRVTSKNRFSCCIFGRLFRRVLHQRVVPSPPATRRT